MTQTWHILQPGWRDLVDILLVSVLVYQGYRLMKGTRAVPMFFGMLLILFFYFVVQVMELALLSLIFREFATVWAIAVVILFQPELRRFLIQTGNSPLINRFLQLRPTGVIEEVVRAAVDLSSRQYGGLIVLIRNTGIKGVVETGIRLDAEVTSQLLVSLFFPRTPLHDGAALIEGNRLVAASCILPLTENPDVDLSLGTRHRAALGISESSDAIVVVVSEETGNISVVQNGVLLKMSDEQALRTTLHKQLDR